MRFPRERLKFATTQDGRVEPGGFLVLDIKGLDIEGVNQLVIEMRDVETVREKGDQQAEARKTARELLGG